MGSLIDWVQQQSKSFASFFQVLAPKPLFPRAIKTGFEEQPFG